jgi:phage-related tail fiber protein
MFQKISWLILIGFTSFISVGCSQFSSAEDSLKKEKSNLQALVLGQQQTITSEAASLFSLNGSYSNFTGDGTTSTTTTHIIAKTGLTGLWLDDSRLDDSTTYSICLLIVEFSGNTIYTQNPPINGACFANDTNKGKFNKIVYFANPAKANSFYYCTTAFGKATLAEAKADVTVADSTKISNGCGGGFAWSRIDKK